MHYINSSPQVSNLGGREDTHRAPSHSQFTRLLKHTLLPRLSSAQAKHEPPRVGYSILACPALTGNARSLGMNITEDFQLYMYPNLCHSDTGAPAGPGKSSTGEASTRRIGTF